MGLLELFCSVDDFWQVFAPHWHKQMLVGGTVQHVAGSPFEVSFILSARLPHSLNCCDCLSLIGNQIILTEENVQLERIDNLIALGLKEDFM